MMSSLSGRYSTVKQIEIMKKFLSKINSLDRIHQWEERDSVIRESVSQHSFKVSAIAIYILNDIIDKNPFLEDDCKFAKFKYDSASYAVLHDFDEAIIGRDISHAVKYNSFNGDEIRDALNKFVAHNIKGEYKFTLKPTADVNLFVKLCDLIALSTFIKRNKNMGVKTFDNEESYCRRLIYEKSREVVKMLKGFGVEYFFKFDIL